MSECTYRETGCGSCENQTNCPYDKMTIEQAIEELKVEYLGDTDRIRKAKDIAIKSLDMWDKVIAEIEENNPNNYFSYKPIIITKKTVIETIEKYKKEIEEK